MESFLNTYFASANGYSGFRSYFQEVFNPEHFDRLFILKGGPGSGKSTLMKRIAKRYDGELAVEKILCSSDKASLDGVIIKSEKRRVAVIDGTAPHTKDPIYPGAIDEIVSLGDFWNADSLISQREEILALSHAKALHYKNAYEYLASIKKEYEKELEKSQNVYFKHLIKSRNITKRLVSSFSKDGYFTLPTSKFYKKSKRIKGDIFSVSDYLKDEILNSKRDGLILFISPLDDSILEGYFDFSNSELVFSSLKDADTEITLFRASESQNSSILISRAKLEFSLASEAHMALEKIYTASMDFDKMSIGVERVFKNIESVIYSQ